MSEHAMSLPSSRSAGLSRAAMIAPGIGALLYPCFVLGAYFGDKLLRAGTESGALLLAASLIGAFGVPLGAFAEAYHLGKRQRRSVGEQRARALCHLVVATPPLFGAFGVASVMLAVPHGDYWAWALCWLAVIACMAKIGGNERTYVPRAFQRVRLRLMHGLSAATLVLIFIAMHLGNHLTAIWSLQVHSMVLMTLRHWYRLPLIEALIVALMLFQIGSGLALLHEKIGRRADFFDAVQTATGVYLAIYIAAHMSAVFLLGRWFLGMDTGTSYVFSSQGYLADPFSVRFITHYGLGAFAVIAHAGCGLRGILLAHGTKPQVANRVFAWTATTGAAVGTVIALALCAVRI